MPRYFFFVCFGFFFSFRMPVPLAIGSPPFTARLEIHASVIILRSLRYARYSCATRR
jgi:hypothetical protein